MTIAETKEWFQVFFSRLAQKSTDPSLHMVLCVPFTVLGLAKEIIEKASCPIALGAQDVSPFGKGPYTGEISAEMLKELVSYVLVGHSERRQYFLETDEELVFQVLQAKTAGLQVIYCISDVKETVPESVDIVAYEPISAIGTGRPEEISVISTVSQELERKYHKPILYGGSVTEHILHSLTDMSSVHGVLVGTDSLDPVSFYSLGQQIVEKD